MPRPARLLSYGVGLVFGEKFHGALCLEVSLLVGDGMVSGQSQKCQEAFSFCTGTIGRNLEKVAFAIPILSAFAECILDR
jgi:hypothetical protein